MEKHPFVKERLRLYPCSNFVWHSYVNVTTYQSWRLCKAQIVNGILVEMAAYLQRHKK